MKLSGDTGPHRDPPGVAEIAVLCRSPICSSRPRAPTWPSPVP